MARKSMFRAHMSPPPMSGLGNGVLRPRLAPPAVAAPENRAPRSIRTGFAESWSNLASPPVMVLTSFLMISSGMAGAERWIWTGVHAIVAVMFPLVMLVALHRMGEVSDLEVTDRRQRLAPLTMSLLCSAVSLVLMKTGDAPESHADLALAFTVIGGVLVCVSRFWKISVHAAAAAVAGTLSWQLTGSPLWLMVLVTTTAASRVFLGRHTPAQVVAGSLLGVVAAQLFAF